MEPGPPQTSEMENFAKIVTFQRIESKVCALNIWAAHQSQTKVSVAEKFQAVTELRFDYVTGIQPFGIYFFAFDRKYGSRHLILANVKKVEKLKKCFWNKVQNQNARILLKAT